MADAAQHFSIPVEYAPSGRDLANIWIAYGPPSRHILPKGWTKDPGRRPLPTNMIWEKDIKVPLRDGVHLLADIFSFRRQTSSCYYAVESVWKDWHR